MNNKWPERLSVRGFLDRLDSHMKGGVRGHEHFRKQLYWRLIIRLTARFMNPKSTFKPSTKASFGAANALLGACVLAQGTAFASTFGDDIVFLKGHTDLVVLT